MRKQGSGRCPASIKPLFVAALLAAPLIAGAQATSPVDEYVLKARQGYFICQLQMKVILVVEDAEAKRFKRQNFHESCLADAAIKELGFDRALRATKKKGAQDALKNFHVAYLTAVRGLDAADEERVFQYEERQRRLQEKFEEARARLEVEQ